MSVPQPPPVPDAGTAARALAAGDMTLPALVESALARIAAREPTVGAWTTLGPDDARAQALHVPPRAPLAGVLLGVKDVIDTARLPTECGSPIHAGRRPARDAAALAALVAAGAVVIGKTVTTEFATFHPAATRNPHHPAHTPGGSSSGSAAAVADGHVNVALGTQTAGSIIRPASYCGVVGYKPSYGTFDYDGILVTAPSLDTLGLFATTVADVHRCAAVLDRTGVVGTPASEDGPPPRVGLCRTPWWSSAEPAMQRLVEHAARRVRAAGASVVEVELPAEFVGLPEAHRLLMEHELASALADARREHRALLSATLTASLDAGASLSIAAAQRARRAIRSARAALPGAFAGCDVLLMPPATGPAPHGVAATGDPIFCRAWSAVGAPCLTLPAGSAGRLPMGVQLVARVDDDRDLLAAARWIEAVLRSNPEPLV
jgi:Asp-tRNA(Asn)/Glu-tRNA(Gln) amidotransferase A subunit family amidase